MEVPTLEQFKKDIMAIYANGDIVEAHQRLKWHYINTPDFKDEKIYATLLSKFKDHVTLWQQKHGEKEEKYISAEVRKELKNIHDFLGAYMWRQEFKGLVQSKARDKYLFPNTPTDELKKQLQRFKDRSFISWKDSTPGS